MAPPSAGSRSCGDVSSMAKEQRVRRESLPRWMRWAAWGGVAAVLLIGGSLAWRLQPVQPPSKKVQPQTTAAVTKRSGNPAGYLGPQACAPCHQQRVADFRKTNHFRTSRLPSDEPMPPGFGAGEGTYATRDPSLTFEMHQEGKEYLQSAVRITPTGQQRTTEKIGLVYGAGGGDEVYHYWRDSRLFQLPVAWMRPTNKWINAPGFKDGTARFDRETAARCVECHNTWFTHVPGTANQYQRDSLILGVTCERCHGPAREHVQYHEAHPKDDAAQAIVHPGELAREQQMDLCGQCHSNADKRRTPPFSFRPGDKLADHFRIDVGKQPEDDHTANQVYYLRQSKCFQKSDSLTCITCHDPHQPTGPASVAASRGACLSCHQPEHCQEQPKVPEAVRGDCVGCHMPARPAMSVYFHTENDDFVPLVPRHEHRIAIYPAGRLEVLWNWHRSRPDETHRQEAARLAKELADYWVAEAESFQGQYRFLAVIGAYRQAQRFAPDPATQQKLDEVVATQTRLDADMNRAIKLSDERQFAEAIATLEKVLAIKPNLALAHGKLGTCLASIGKKELALTHLHRAVELDPDSPYGDSMLGWLAYLDDDPEKSLEYYRRAEEIEPFSAKVKYHQGLALAKLSRWTEAIDHFQRALEIDPSHADSCVGLSQAYRHERQPAEDLRYALRGATLTRFENLDVLLNLAEAYTGSGRPAEALQTATRALAIAERSSPARAQQIRAQIQEFQLRSMKGKK